MQSYKPIYYDENYINQDSQDYSHSHNNNPYTYKNGDVHNSVISNSNLVEMKNHIGHDFQEDNNCESLKNRNQSYNDNFVHQRNNNRLANKITIIDLPTSITANVILFKITMILVIIQIALRIQCTNFNTINLPKIIEKPKIKMGIEISIKNYQNFLLEFLNIHILFPLMMLLIENYG